MVFFTLFCEIILTIWVVMWLVLRWQRFVTHQLRYKLATPATTNEDDKEWETEED